MAVGSPLWGTLAWQSGGEHTPSWPAGIASGMLVMGWCAWGPRGRGLGPRQTGWRSVTGYVWWRIVSTADIAAGPGVWDGGLVGLVAVPGARGIGTMRWARGVRLREAGSAMLVLGWTERWSGDSANYPSAGIGGPSVTMADRQAANRWLRTYATAGDKQLERDSDIEGYEAFEILPSKAPDAPLITKPAAAEHLDVSQPLAVTLLHQSAAGLDQEARKVRVRISGGSYQHVTAAGTLSGTEQAVATASPNVTIGAGLLAAGQWLLSASTMEAGQWSPWSAETPVVLEVAPSSSVVLTTGHGDLTPLVSWTPTTPAGVQTARRVLVVPAGGGPDSALCDSMWMSGAGTSWVSPTAGWDQGGSYEALVMIEQTGGLRSAWARSAPASITWTPPTAPASIAVADGSPLTVTVAGIPPTSLAVSLEWASSGVDDWTLLAWVDAPIGSAQVAVPLAPYGVGRRYRVRSWESVDGVWVPSAWRSTPAAVASTDMASYLVDGGSWLRVLVRSIGRTEVVEGVAVSYGLTRPGDGEARPMVDRTPAIGRAGSMVVQTRTQAAREALADWLGDHLVWWYRATPERDDDGVLHDAPAIRMARASSRSWQRVEQSNLALEEFEIQWVEQ